MSKRPAAVYLLDANVFIDAARDYYPIDRVPEFWAWLAHHAAAGSIKVPREIYGEFSDGHDDLAAWASTDTVEAALLLTDEPTQPLVSRVFDAGYGLDLTDTELETIGNDPFLIAAALADPGRRRVVTTEVSKPRTQRQNRRIPDVCMDLGITAMNTFGLLRILDFRTNWKK